jgi:hypothetical protein
VTDRGLTPFDLVAGMPTREEIALLLDNTGDIHNPTSLLPVMKEGGISIERQMALRKHRARAIYRIERDKEKERKARRGKEREQWIREQSGLTSVEAELLLPPKRINGRRSTDSGLAWVDSDDEEESDSEEEEDLGQSVCRISKLVEFHL